MIVIDGIIFSLQQAGGISVLFNELLCRMPAASYRLMRYDKKGIDGARLRFGERYRTVDAGDYSVFHSSYYRLPSARSGAVVTTVHDYTYERFLSPSIKQTVHSYQKNKAVQASDIIICVSESTREDLLEYSSVNPDRVVVIHNGVSEIFCRDDDVALAQQVIFVGARGGYKNFESVVTALSRVAVVELVCVGGGKFSNVESAFLEKYLPNRYRHAGYISTQQLNIEYNKSICLVYPSLYEGFGIPVLEAMRSGCPVVAMNCSSIPEVAGDAAYLMERGSPDEIEAAVRFFMDIGNRTYFVRRGLQRSSMFGWDRTFLKTVAVYEQLIGRKII